jgi:hypothetical protein
MSEKKRARETESGSRKRARTGPKSADARAICDDIEAMVTSCLEKPFPETEAKFKNLSELAVQLQEDTRGLDDDDHQHCLRK